ncbi:MAG: ATP-dependent DNA helicase RecG [Coriobacteriia bacterium]|nr:ATP-dependent DNA helicase RecG [Coriobacteriia bacterium]
MVDRLEATLTLDRPVSSVKQVSPARERVLSSRGIHTVRDLVCEYPFRYVDLSRIATVIGAPIGQSCTIAGSIHKIEAKRTRRRNLGLVEITLVDATGTLMIACFNQPWLTNQYHDGDRIAVAGKVEFNYGFKRMTNPYIERLGDDEAAMGQVIPVHHASEKLKTGHMRAIIRNALEAVEGLDDPLPVELRGKYRLMSRGSALRCIQQPQDMAEVAQARRRLAYEELLLLELQLMARARERSAGKDPATHIVDGICVAALEAALPFELTDEQRVARSELLAAMGAERQANHLLLGDVGTGKTAVALFGLAAVADTGMQAMMMAPTEVLATQYATGLGPLLDTVGVSWALLTGSTAPEERTRILKDAEQGDLVVLFGTHALLEPDVQMPRLSFVVIDEQQRFGVEQRAALVAKGDCPDILSLTATPIPRSLALAVYGDMTLSYLTQRPRNAVGTRTRVFDREQAGDAYEVARQALEQGHQAYVVCPLVGVKREDPEDSRKKGADPVLGGENDDETLAPDAIAVEWDADLAGMDTRAAEEHARMLRRTVFSEHRVGVLHGKLGAEQKRRVMEAFRAHEIDVLVATTVIEVGVDVPNATVMVIEDADRFGLAQLHQLRGRVGRGDAPGEVCLISGSRAPIAVRRLQAMEQIQDGFRLSEYDLSLRREGDILGNRQHGASTLKLVNIMRDRNIIEAAHADAAEMLEADPDLAAPEHAALRRELRLMLKEKP